MVKFDAKAEEFLRRKLFAKLGTLKKNGYPHVTPIWYMYEEGRIFVNTTTNRVKYHNIERDPRVSFLVDDGYPYLMVLGKARIAKERDGNKDIEALAIRYTGEEEGKKSARERYWKQERATIEIIPEKVILQI